MRDDIKVSVCIITYNQENYIEECLVSVLNQNFSYKYEIIVSDDASSDKTTEIIKKLADKYPEKIFPIYHKINVGPVKNLLSAYRAARGEYIAHLDGDDVAYPNKLKKQVDSLDSNLSCVMCSHDMEAINLNSDKISTNAYSFGREGVHGVYTLLDNLPFFAHSSKLFRNISFDDESYHPQALDIEFHMAMIEYGEIYHIAEFLGAYRVGAGITHSVRSVPKIILDGVDRLFANAMKKYEKGMVKKSYAKKLYELSLNSISGQDYGQASNLINKSLKVKVINFKQLIVYVALKFPMLINQALKIKRMSNE